MLEKDHVVGTLWMDFWYILGLFVSTPWMSSQDLRVISGVFGSFLAEIDQFHIKLGVFKQFCNQNMKNFYQKC